LNRSISLIVPAYNEETRLPETLRAVENYFRGHPCAFYEILVVDDGSNDKTASIAEDFAKSNANIRVLRNPGNRGKGYSVRHGMLKASGHWRLFSDADLSTPMEELDKLWHAVERDGADIAIGSRALDRSLIGIHQPGFRETAGRVFNVAMRMTIGLPIGDTQCGFKLFRGDLVKEIFTRQTIERFGFDVEVLFIAQRLGYKIAEVPVRWNHAEGSKVGMLTGLRAFLELAEIRANSLRGRYRFAWRTAFIDP
jgi:glycosyltransferase involved in cell wall biosynthesis